MKNLILMILLSITTLLQAQSFSKNNILGTWEVSSIKENSFTSFGVDFSTQRGLAYTLIFNKKNRVKNTTTGTIYEYEIINGNLKIYQSKTYKNGYKIKYKKRYDLLSVVGEFEGCLKVKIITKKLKGYYRKDGYKFCKTENQPIPTYTTSKKDYNF